MINLIIWSKDRAPQLHLLLESVSRFIPNTFHACIIYTTSNPEFAKGYAKLFNTSIPNVSAIYKMETDWYQDTIDYINWCPTKKYVDEMAFTTDDTVIFRKPPVNDFRPDDAVTFSLRYGLNTIMQDCSRNMYQAPLTAYKDEGDTIVWNFNNYHPLSNYGYPFGLDMHIYKRSELQNLLKYERFSNSNQLESLLFNKKNQVSQLIRSFKESIAVNIPNNNLSGVTASMHGSLEENNTRYLAGEIIDLDNICSQNIIGSHQMISYKWRKE